MDRQRLLNLADKAEKATGPDRDLERAIKAALLNREYISFEDDLANRQAATPPAYTASLDAAMTLKPEGWGYSICPGSVLLTRSADDSGIMARAATPALALVAASLRALAATMED